MSAICGWAGHISGQSPGAALSSMVGAYRGRRRLDASIASETAAIWATAARSGATCDREEPWVGLIGSPRWQDPDILKEERARGSAAALRLAFRKFGTSLLDRVTGAFAFAIVDRPSGSAMLAIDRMGIHSLYYGELNGVLVFGSSADLVRGYPGFRVTVPPQAIYGYLQAYVCRSPNTIYAEQHKLGPAELLLWRNGQASVKSYWRMPFSPARGQSRSELASKLVNEVRGAVRRSLPAGPPDQTGAFLSGGLDSSTVVGMLSEVVDGPAKTFTIGFGETSYDEMFYADATSKRFGAEARRYYLTPDDVAAAAPRIAAYFDEPFGNSSAVPVYFCAAQAQAAGLTCLLAGDGGDEILAGNSRYLEQQTYERYSQAPAALRTILRLVANDTPMLRTTKLWGKAQRYIARAETPLPDRLEAFSFYHLERMAEVFEPDVVRLLDLEAPWRDMRMNYFSAASEDPLQRMMHLDLRHTLADNDLKKVVGMCSLAGIDVQFPFLDDELVAFCASIPPEFHLEQGRLRAFFKDAFKEFLPPEVIAKKKHGFGMPFYEWTRDHPGLRALAYDSLTTLRRRDLLRADFIDAVMTNHARTEATLYDGLVWDLMMLELWLQHHPIGG